MNVRFGPFASLDTKGGELPFAAVAKTNGLSDESGRSEKNCLCSDANAAKVGDEPRVIDAAKCANDSFSKHSGRSSLNCNANLQSRGDLGRAITSPEF